jgi:hypothetical protein
VKQYTAQQLLNVLSKSWTHMLDAIVSSACLDEPVLGVLWHCCAAQAHVHQQSLQGDAAAAVAASCQIVEHMSIASPSRLTMPLHYTCWLCLQMGAPALLTQLPAVARDLGCAHPGRAISEGAIILAFLVMQAGRKAKVRAVSSCLIPSPTCPAGIQQVVLPLLSIQHTGPTGNEAAMAGAE